MTNNTKSYFNSVANNYSDSSSKGFWNLVRKNEKKTIIDLIQNKEYKNILELGSGSGFYTEYLLNYTKNKVTCVDFSEEMLNKIDFKNVIKINSNIEDFSHDTNYDLIFCAGALEFVNNINKFFNNLEKLLSPDGVFITLVPYTNIFGLIYKIFHFSHNIKINLFTNKIIYYHSNFNGLRVIKIKKAFPFSRCYLIQKI